MFAISKEIQLSASYLKDLFKQNTLKVIDHMKSKNSVQFLN